MSAGDLSGRKFNRKNDEIYLVWRDSFENLKIIDCDLIGEIVDGNLGHVEKRRIE